MLPSTTRRRALISLLVLAALGGATLIALTLALRLGYLESWLITRVQTKLAEYGARLEIGSLKTTFRNPGFEATDLRVFVEGAEEPFATVRKVSGTVRLRDILGFSGPTEIQLESATIEGIRARYHIDADGRSNVDGLHASTTPSGRFSFLYSSATTTVKDAEFLYLDRLHKLDGAARDVALTLAPAADSAMSLVLSSRNAEFSYDGRTARDFDLDLKALLRSAGATVESLQLRSPYANAKLSGILKSWREFDYELDARADLNLRELAQIIAPDLKLTGATRFEGRVEGSGIEYRASGKLQGEKLTVRDVRLNAIALKASGEGKGADATGRTEIAIGVLEAAGFRVNRFSAAGDFATASSSFDWRGTLRADSFAGRGVSGGGASVERAQLQGPFDSPTSAKLTGRLRIASLVTADIPVGSILGEVSATANFIELPQFTADFFGGQIKGKARLALAGRSESQLVADVSKIDVDQAVAAGAGKRLPLRGQGDGRIDLRWPGGDYRAAVGSVNLTFAGDALPGLAASDGVRLNGAITLTAANRQFRLEDSLIRTGLSELRATGWANWDGEGAFDVHLNSTDASELQRLIVDFSNDVDSTPAGAIARYLRQYEIQLDRGLRFDGMVSGNRREPVIAGRFGLDSITVSDEPLGQLEGEIDYRSDSLHLEKAVLKQANGGQADFSLEYAFDAENSASWFGTLKGVSIGPLAKFITDAKLGGTVSGTAELYGIPEAMRGKGQFVVEKASYDDLEAPEIRGTFALNGTRVEAQNASIKFAGGSITGGGWFDTRTKGYQLNLHGEGLEIAEVIKANQAGRDLKFDLNGLFDVKLEVASEEFKRQDTGSRIFDRLAASITSRELRHGAESLGDVQLTASGTASVLEVNLAANLLEHRYNGSGRIDFSRKEAPVQGKIDLSDVAIGPIVAMATDDAVSAPGTLAGEIRFAGNLFGDRDRFRVEAELSKLTIESRDMQLAALPPVLLKLQEDQLDIGLVRFSGPDTNLEVSGSIAIGEKGRMALTANGDVNLRLVQNFVPGVTADGIVRVQMAASGSFGQPRLSGSATVENVAFRSREFPLALTKGSGRLLFTNDQAQVASFTGEIGGGAVSITGGAALAGFAPDRWRLQARLTGVRIDYPQDFRTTADGELTLQGNRRLQVLSGLLNVRRGEFLAELDIFDLIERFMTELSGGSVGGSTGASGFPSTQFDLRVVANDSLAISNKSLDLVASADMKISGTLDEPVFGGRLTISRGLIDDFFKERYRITSGLIEFSGVSQRPPRLSIDAETVISGYRLSVLIAGPLDNLRITPRTEPPLPQADVIALMTSGALPREGLTGDSPSQSLAQTQATNLSTLLTQPLSSRIGSNVTGRLFGLNRFSIDPLVTGRGTDPTARITVGRRVTKDLSITYSTNLASNQDQLILIEYRASDRLSFVASRAEDGAFGLDVRLRKRF
ncbi:MAG: translocation/assembly module TamB domain-containing protein [Acidobacteriota bacterium]